MTITKRALLAAAGTAAGSTLLSRAAGAQSFPFAPNQRCPDPAVQILDPGFAKYRIGASLPVTALADAFYSEVE
jgi:gluconolactonase